MITLITFRAMGCAASVQMGSADPSTSLLEAVPGQVEALEQCLSRFRPLSELMRLNAQAGEWVPVSKCLFDAVQAAKQAARHTDGRYNPLVLPAMLANGYDRSFEHIGTPPPVDPQPAPDWRGIHLGVATREIAIPPGSALDLGGIGKGWAADQLADQLAEQGPCLVNFGGDIAARGAPEGSPAGWPVEIHDPTKGTSLGTLHLRDASIATSGNDYRRWTTADGQARHHLIDPATGQPADSDVCAVTVIHPVGATAEADAKAVFLQGAAQGLAWLNTQWNASGLVIQTDGMVLATSSFPSLFTSEGYERTIV